MKYQTLRLIASCLKVLTWVVVAVGIVSSIILGIRASSLIPAITFLLGGFVLTAIYALVLLAISKSIYLFIDIEQDLSEIARQANKELKD